MHLNPLLKHSYHSFWGVFDFDIRGTDEVEVGSGTYWRMMWVLVTEPTEAEKKWVCLTFLMVDHHFPKLIEVSPFLDKAT